MVSIGCCHLESSAKWLRASWAGSCHSLRWHRRSSRGPLKAGSGSALWSLCRQLWRGSAGDLVTALLMDKVAWLSCPCARNPAGQQQGKADTCPGTFVITSPSWPSSLRPCLQLLFGPLTFPKGEGSWGHSASYTVKPWELRDWAYTKPGSILAVGALSGFLLAFSPPAAVGVTVSLLECCLGRGKLHLSCAWGSWKNVLDQIWSPQFQCFLSLLKVRVING